MRLVVSSHTPKLEELAELLVELLVVVLRFCNDRMHLCEEILIVEVASDALRVVLKAVVVSDARKVVLKIVVVSDALKVVLKVVVREVPRVWCEVRSGIVCER